MPKMRDVTGQRFGYLIASSFTHVIQNGKKLSAWNCKCDCGKEVIVLAGNLYNGKTLSCGCMRGKLISNSKIKHGMHDSRIYMIWKGIRGRCYVDSNQAYDNYGGRGIVMCQEWKESFVKFMEWAFQNGYSDTLSIDRIDVNGNYEPENCRWITMHEQSYNKRNSKLIEIDGVTKCLSEWSQITGIDRKTLSGRYERGDKTRERLFRKPEERRVKHA